MSGDVNGGDVPPAARPVEAPRTLSLADLPPSPLADQMGITLLEASPERVIGTMRVEGNTQPFGLLHGGASCVLAETLGSVGAWLHAGPGKIAVGVDINATHHRAMRAGLVTGVATPAHLGRSIATYEVVMTDEESRRVATARITCQIIVDRSASTPP